MHKVKLFGFAIVCMVGFMGISPITAIAAETNTESVTLSDANKSQKDRKAAFEEKMKKASEKWKTLTAKQKQEIYALLESNMQVEVKLMDKLVEFGVLEKEDVVNFKTHMLDKFNKLKESGEFPLIRQKDNKRSK